MKGTWKQYETFPFTRLQKDLYSHVRGDEDMDFLAALIQQCDPQSVLYRPQKVSLKIVGSPH